MFIKVKIEEDELYPFFKMDDPRNENEGITINPDTFNRWQRVMDEFWQVQKEMKEAWDKTTEDHNCTDEYIEITQVNDIHRRYKCYVCGYEWFGDRVRPFKE